MPTEPSFTANVRKRPSMYIGSTDHHGLHHLVYALLDAAFEDGMRRGVSVLDVGLGGGGSCTVFHDGPPVPFEALDAHLREPPGISESWRSIVSALSSEFRIDCWDGRAHWFAETRRGEVVVPPKRKRSPPPIPAGAASGVLVTFTPDQTIFTANAQIRVDVVAERLRELAILIPGLRVDLKTSTRGLEQSLQYADGPVARVRELAGLGALPFDPIVAECAWDEFRLRVAFQWLPESRSGGRLESYANTVRTIHGGRHVVGFLAALSHALTAIRPKPPKPLPEQMRNRLVLTPHAFAPKLCAFIAFDGPRSRVQFEGPMKTALGIEGLDAEIAKRLAPQLEQALVAHQENLTRLFGRFFEIEAGAWGLRGGTFF